MANSKHTFGKGMGLAALAAAAAGAYYFYGSSKAAKHRKNLKAWAVKARGEVLEKMEQLHDVSQQAYDKTVEEVMAGYKNIKEVTPTELSALGKELKSHWKSIAKEINKYKPGQPKKTSKAKGKK